MEQITIILVEPQMGENIGAAARAMLNCGLVHLRLVAPRDGWPNEKAVANASGAASVVEQAQIFETTQQAVADLHYVLASTARPRDMVKPVYTPAGGVAAMQQRAQQGEKIGLLFGPERTGLQNSDVQLCDGIITVPLNPDYSSLNIAQAVLLLAWEWRRAHDETAPVMLNTNNADAATKDEMNFFLNRLDSVLDDAGFFTSPQMKNTMSRNIHNIFTRNHLTGQEIRTLQGVLTALIKR